MFSQRLFSCLVVPPELELSSLAPESLPFSRGLHVPFPTLGGSHICSQTQDPSNGIRTSPSPRESASPLLTSTPRQPFMTLP